MILSTNISNYFEVRHIGNAQDLVFVVLESRPLKDALDRGHRYLEEGSEIESHPQILLKY